MAEIIRTVRLDEWDKFMKFLERCYGHSRGFFVRSYPQLYRPEKNFLSSFLIMEREGRIVSHIGIFPLEVFSFEAHFTVAGIGGVATLPEERGRGHMSTLLEYASELIKMRGWPLSVLWGDRQRYYTFGYEISGLKYSLFITRRSLNRAGIKEAEIMEVPPLEAVRVIEDFHKILPLRVKRMHDLSLKKYGIRTWIGDEGYVISSGEVGSPRILEVASPNGKEPELIKAVIESCFGDSATIDVSAFDHERLRRLYEITSNWTIVPEGLFRIMNVTGLLKSYQEFLSKRTKLLADFELSIGLNLRGAVDWVTIKVKGGKLEIIEGRHSSNYIELDEREAVRLFLGGPLTTLNQIGPLSVLFPLPLHIPILDHV